MRNTLAAGLLLVNALGALAAEARADVMAPSGCQGLAVARFEQGVPDEIKRYAFSGPMLQPFLQLWQASAPARGGRRPALPAAPEAVTVYDLPQRPYLLGYQRAGCVIAFLTVEREQFWRSLRPSLGWPA